MLKPSSDTLPTSTHPPFNLSETLQQSTLFETSNYHWEALETQDTTLPLLNPLNKTPGASRPNKYLVT